MYYILLGHFLYATWGSIIIGVLEAIIGVYITLSAPVVLLNILRCVVVQVWLTNAKKAQSLLWNCAYEDGCLFQKIVTSLPQLLPLQPLPEDS